jgi:hypothetical protein
LGNDIVLPAVPVPGPDRADTDREPVLFKDERGQPLELLPDGSFGHAIEIPEAPDGPEVKSAGRVRIPGNVSDERTLLQIHILV